MNQSDKHPQVTNTLPIGDFAHLPVARPTISGPYWKYCEHDALFLSFAEVSSPADLRVFVARYGHADTCEDCRVLKFRMKGGEGVEIPLSPFFQHVDETRWLLEALSMCTCVEIWRMVQASDRVGLKKLIRWVTEESGVAVFFEGGDLAAKFYEEMADPSGRELIASTSSHEDVLDVFGHSDVFRPALFWVQRVLNRRLAASVEARALWDGQGQAMTLHFVPRDILGGLWLQFAQAFTGDKQYERCRTCGEWFEVSKDAARTNRRFCSNACRQTSYRERKKAKKGKKPQEGDAELQAKIEKLRQEADEEVQAKIEKLRQEAADKASKKSRRRPGRK
jgi:hypothetical protein